jgi:hypothetical protein
MDQMGLVPWDRFQTLAGIQFYFDTEFRLVRGHVYYSGTEWGLSSINQQDLWERKPVLPLDGFASVLSVDIGDFNTPSDHLHDEYGRGKAARDCTFDELATEVWRQIVTAIISEDDDIPEALLPWPIWYAVDRSLVARSGPGQGEGPPVRNEAPYLIPIKGDWPNRPGADPWDPSGTSWTTRPTDELWTEDLEWRNVWQARHGGYQVHDNSVVFAGTWTRTFTRMTTMEAACESARHAVNAVLDHYVWVETGGIDRREGTRALDWQTPVGFLHQGIPPPMWLPSPAGDYCFVFDIENREPLDIRRLRNTDSANFRASLPYSLGSSGPVALGALGPRAPSPTGGQQVTTSPDDYSGRLLAYLQAWRQYLEQTIRGTAPGQPLPTAPWPVAPTPSGPPAPPLATPGQAWPTIPWPMPAVPGLPVPPVATPPGTRRPDLPMAASPATDETASAHPLAGDPPRERTRTSSAAGEQGREANCCSLFDPALTTSAGPGTDPPAASAYRWTGDPTGPGDPAAARSLYTIPTGSPPGSPPVQGGPPASPGARLRDARMEIIGGDPPA